MRPTSSLSTRGSLERKILSASALQLIFWKQPLEGGEKTAHKEKKKNKTTTEYFRRKTPAYI